MNDRVQLLVEHAQLLHRSILETGLGEDIEGLAAELCTYLQLRSLPPTPSAPMESEDGEEGEEGEGVEVVEVGTDPLRPAEAMALAAPTGANAWIGEFLLAHDGVDVRARYEALGPELVPDRPLTLWHAKRTPVPNAVRLEDVPLPRLLDLVCKPSEQVIGGVDVLLLTRFTEDSCVANLIQVKLGGSHLYLGREGGKRATVRHIVGRLRDRGQEVLRRLQEAYPGVGFLPVLHLWTTRPLSKPARDWLEGEGVRLRDRAALWHSWPARVQAWAGGASTPDCPPAPTWLRPGY